MKILTKTLKFYQVLTAALSQPADSLKALFRNIYVTIRLDIAFPYVYHIPTHIEHFFSTRKLIFLCSQNISNNLLVFLDMVMSKSIHLIMV